MQHRRELMERWEGLLYRYVDEPDEEKVLRDADFMSLRPHLARETLGELEYTGQVQAIVDAGGVSARLRVNLIADELARLRREWKLS